MRVTSRLLERILGEYREMPGLSLTPAQAARLWGLEGEFCKDALQALVAAGHLRQSADGKYCTAATA